MPHPKVPAMYHVVTERGLVRWGAHVRTVARRDDLEPMADPRPCPTCRHGVWARHWVADCRWRHLFRLAVHTQLHIRLDTFCACWKRRAVSKWGVVGLYGLDAFALRMRSPSV